MVSLDSPAQSPGASVHVSPAEVQVLAVQVPPTAVQACVVVAVEGYLYWRYRALGAEFHFWLHGLFGAAIGVAATTGWALLRRRRPAAVWGPGLAGHVYSAFPDALFLSAGIQADHLSLEMSPLAT